MINLSTIILIFLLLSDFFYDIIAIMEVINLNERLKELRKALAIKQGDFAERISTTQGHISDIENGRKELSDRTIKLICLEFNVNEEWLRTGAGEMFIQLDKKDELTAWFGSLVNPNNDNEFMKKFVHMLSKLDVTDWKVLEKMALLMVEEEKDKG